MTLTISSATEDDARHVANFLRAADVAEMAACGSARATYEREMVNAARQSQAMCARSDGAPFLIWGLGPDGYVWALGTDDVRRHRMTFLRKCRDEIEAIRERAGVPLWTVAWVGNPEHLSWLRWCGFRFAANHTRNRWIMVRDDV